MATTPTKLYYAIIDGQDGSAGLRLFDSREALDLFLELNEVGDMSEGGGCIDLTTVFTSKAWGSAMSVEDVKAEYCDEE